MRIELVFLKIANNDLKAAKLLLDKKLYAQSVFFMEQSIEKAIKALGIRRGDITPAEAKRYRHRPIRYYLKFFGKIKMRIAEAQIGVKDIEKRYPVLSELFRELGIPEMNSRHSAEKKMYEDLWNIASRVEEEVKRDPLKTPRTYRVIPSGRTLDRYIAWWRERESQVRRSWRALDQIESKSFRDELARYIPRFVAILRRLAPRLATELPSDDKLSTIDPEKVLGILQKSETRSQTVRYAYEYLGNKLYDEAQEFFFIGSLFFLALLFFPHAIHARYPDEGFENPLSFYDARNPLVLRLDQLIEIAEDTLDFMDVWIQHSP